MAWDDIDNVTANDAPFVAWIEPFAASGPDAATIEYECELDANGLVIDADGNILSDVTHWRT